MVVSVILVSQRDNPQMFPGFCAMSFDRGFHSPANRARLDELLVDNVLPKKGRLSKADRYREQGETFCSHAPSAPRCGVGHQQSWTPWPRPCSVERSEGICPKCCFGSRCPERASPRTYAASASAGTTSSRSLKQAKTNSLLQPANCRNQRVFLTMIKLSRIR